MNSEQVESAKKLLFIALFIDLVFLVIVGVKNFSIIAILHKVQSGTLEVDQTLLDNIEFWDSLSRLPILTMIGVGLALVKWLNSCYRYAKDTIGARGFKNENWTAIGWIFPFFNLFKPYQIINEIYKAGATEYVAANDWKKESGSGFLLVWWVFWSVIHFVFAVIGKQLLRGSMRDDLTLSQVIGMYETRASVYVVSIIVAFFWFLVANYLTGRLLDRKPITSQRNNENQLCANSHASVQALNASSLKSPTAVNATYDEDCTLTTSFLGKTSSSPTNFSGRSEPMPSTDPVAGLIGISESNDWAYQIVATELEQKTQDRALWTRAFSEAFGDESKTKALYIKMRVQRIISTEAERIWSLNAQRLRELDIRQDLERKEKNEGEMRRSEGARIERENQEKIERADREYRQPISQTTAYRTLNKENRQNAPYRFNARKYIAGVVVILGVVYYLAGLLSGTIH